MSIQIDKDYIIRIRRELHQVPELGFELPRTLAIVRRELDALGVPYTDALGKSSIVAILNEGIGNKTIGLRADMDALPITEETGLPFASTIPGQMHACGHDVHTAMLLGTVKALKAMEKDVKCCVKFIFQACEENLGGAKALCEDRLMDSIDKILACHITPIHKAGTIRTNKGCVSACSHGFRVHLYGKASHVARPHLGVDAIAMAARIYSDIQFYRARELNPVQPAVIGIGEIHGGRANNILCDYVMMHGSIRTHDNELDQQIYRRIQEICNNVASDMGGRAVVETTKYSPALLNNGQIVDELRESALKVVPEEAFQWSIPGMGAEDFAFYSALKPGALFNLGVQPTDGPTVPNHNGKMIVNEDVLDIAPRVFVQYVLDQMEK